MTAKPNSDPAMEKALRRTLRERLASSGKDCPDASLLAAYSDRDLPAEEVSRWETHFSSCTRCQEQLAVLARTDPSCGFAARESAESRPAAQSATWRRFWMLRWVAPLATAAAAVALWVALRPLPPDVTAPRTGEIAQRAAKEEANVPLAQAPAKPAEADKEAATTGVNAKLSTMKTETKPTRVSPGVVAPAAPRVGREAAKAENQIVAGQKHADEKEAETSSVSAKVEIAGKASTPPQPANAPLDKSEARANARESRETESTGKKKEAAPSSASAKPEYANVQAATAPKAQQQALADTAPQEAAAKSGAQAPLPAGTGQASTRGAFARADAPRQRSQMPARRLPGGFEQAPIVVAAPGGNTQWRFGPKGRIEKSRDAGKTWTLQASPVTFDLFAGSAPAGKVCWAVGTAGTILRTTDGEQWEQVSSPTTTDLQSVTARDALRATVVTADGKTYVTSDGGRTWKLK